MTALIESNPTYRRAAMPTMTVAGVDWPVYKLRAVAVAVVVAVVSLLLFTHEVTAWLSAVALVLTWWTGRIQAGKAATAAASKPAGIS